jgi:hypothetical protein
VVLAVEHLHYWGGPDESYRLNIHHGEPTFQITAVGDRVDAPLGGSGLLNLQVTRQGYTGPIEIAVASPKAVRGETKIAANGTAGMMILVPDKGASVSGEPLVLVGKATINGQPVIVPVNQRAQIVTLMGNAPFPPMHLFGELAVGVAEKGPFTVEVKYEPAEVTKGSAVTAVVSITKAVDFDEEVQVSSIASATPPPVPAVNGKIAKGQSEVKLPLKPPATLPNGLVAMTFSAKAKYKGKEVAAVAPSPGFEIIPPFTLQVEPAKLDLKVGGKVKLKVTAERKGGYEGPIALALTGAPAEVTGAKAEIAAKMNQAELEIAATATAATGEKMDVVVTGTATAAMNQTNTSTTFTINVVK